MIPFIVNGSCNDNRQDTEAKKDLLFPEMWMTSKIFTRAAANLFFLIDFLTIFSFLLFLLLFCILVFYACLFVFWNQKYIFWYTFNNADGWVMKKFHLANFRKQDYFFWPDVNFFTTATLPLTQIIFPQAISMGILKISRKICSLFYISVSRI